MMVGPVHLRTSFPGGLKWPISLTFFIVCRVSFLESLAAYAPIVQTELEGIGLPVEGGRNMIELSVKHFC